MANIDLGAEKVGPLGAGFAMQFLGADVGFVLVGVANAVSFGVELLLLAQVHRANPRLGAPKLAPAGRAPGKCEALVGGLPVFTRAPSGVPLLVLSYALLYYTVWCARRPRPRTCHARKATHPHRPSTRLAALSPPLVAPSEGSRGVMTFSLARPGRSAGRVGCGGGAACSRLCGGGR